MGHEQRLAEFEARRGKDLAVDGAGRADDIAPWPTAD